MKTTFFILILGLTAIAAIIFLILVEIIELLLGIVGIVLALILIGWLYKKMKDKLE